VPPCLRALGCDPQPALGASVVSLLLALTTFLYGQTHPTTAAAPASVIPRASLLEMYQRELGSLYRPELADGLYRAHELVERYFAVPGERKRLLNEIEATGVDPNLLGRITRLHMGWPALEGGVYYINERFGVHTVLYFLGVPRGYDRTRAWPLVIKLPAAHAFVTEPPPTADQVVAIYSRWMREELAAHPDAVCIMPLLNLGEFWGPSYAGMNAAIQPMLHVTGQVNIDPARVYLVGHGMSAHAVWNLGLHYTTYFAAINPLAGGAKADWQRLRLVNLRNVLPVVWHDAADTAVDPESSRQLVKILRGFNYDVDYEETQGIGHVPPDQVVQRAYDKMLARRRDLYPREVVVRSNRRDAMFNRIDWLQIYQPTNPGKEVRNVLAHGSGHIMLCQHAFGLTGRLAGRNRIEIDAQNVDIFRIHLNDQMVDFSRAVNVIVNGRQRYEGMLRPSIEAMLSDQLFLGRGWRYFTGVIDIDLAPASTRPATTFPATRGRIEVIDR